MKYRFAVEAIFTKEIEIEAASEEEAWKKADDVIADVTYTPADESGFDRELFMLDK